jgi:hypothetical protein
MPIFVAEGNRRPHNPMQATKFASEVGVVVRCQVPILMHWKHYKKPSGVVHYKNCGDRLSNGYPLLTFNSTLSNFNGFTFQSHYCVQSRLSTNEAHPPTQEAC